MERTVDDDGVRDVSSQQSSSQQAGENLMVEMMRIFFQEREQEKLEREAYKLQEQRDREQEKLEREAYKLQKQRDREQEKREREAYKLQKQRDRQEREQKEREKERETERKWFDLNTMIGTMQNRLDNIDANLEARIRTVTVEYISELSTKVNERIEGILQKVDACESTVGNVHKDIKVQIESFQAVTTEVSKKSAEVGAKVNKLADNVVTLQDALEADLCDIVILKSSYATWMTLKTVELKNELAQLIIPPIICLRIFHFLALSYCSFLL
ncbi:RNA-binding protein 25-like [Schistocerca cancellata]|uniref:RNA-binding protein 25-like n=1 Tax=Schistocerca cancellata TaxID=274614 RepID=UPI002118CA18|nr:RNA-binding protein 25-like [Schistocerca cancellata]